MHNVIVLGKGYLGKEFERHGIETWGRDKFNIEYPYNSTNIDKQLELLKNYKVVINCIAKSNTRWCEQNENFEEALFVNGCIPKILSRFCNKHDIQFVQISTGCLYDDITKPNNEKSFISAHCNYTITKWIGEVYCNKQDLIMRPRLYFSDIKDKNNLLCKLPSFNHYVGDVVNSLTCTSTIVGAVKELIFFQQHGIFNVAQQGSATMADIASWCNLPVNSTITSEELRNKENLYLVNNVMDISKLLPFYVPLNIENSIKLSHTELNNPKNK